MATDFSVLDFTATAPSGKTFDRELHRLTEDGMFVYQMPNFEDEYGVPDPKRYRLKFVGYSDVFEEPDKFNDGMLKQRVIIELEVMGSKKWKDTRFSMAMNIPKDWTNEKGKLHQLFSALQGRPIQDGDRISFSESLGTEFEGVVENTTSEKGRDYASVTTFLPLQEDDDDEDEFPTK
jgi:hypothetical protein